MNCAHATRRSRLVARARSRVASSARGRLEVAGRVFDLTVPDPKDVERHAEIVGGPARAGFVPCRTLARGQQSEMAAAEIESRDLPTFVLQPAVWQTRAGSRDGTRVDSSAPAQLRDSCGVL
jgi:hypothetical protein